MQFLKRFYQPITLLAIAVAVTSFLSLAAPFDDKPPSGEAAVLLEQVDGVIAKLQRNSLPSEAAEQGRSGAVPVAGPGADSAQQPGQAGNALSIAPGQTHVSTEAAEKAPAGSGAKTAAPQDNTDDRAGETATPLAPSSDATAGESDNNAQGEGTSEQIWRQARLAALQGEFAVAIEHYRALVARQPDNFDAYGEMGNVLLNSGDREGAAEAYYQAAVLLNNTPHRMMAWRLLTVLSWLAPEKADKLYQALLPRP